MGSIPSQEVERSPNYAFRTVEMYNLKQVYYYLCLHTTTLTSCPLDRNQFFAVLADRKQFKALWRPLFEAIDQKRDNVIDFEEFLTFVKHLKRGEPAERRQLCFRLLDVHHDGYGSKGDVQWIASAFMELKPRSVPSGDGDRANKYLQLFSSLPHDNDDRFTYQDFETLCTTHGDAVVNETLELIETMFDGAIEETGIDITATDVVNSKPHIDWQDHNIRMGSCFCCKSQTTVFTKAPPAV
eukprot:NODE_15984_length_1018_cov_7.711560.p1 GENE.NODE_15984_length_1018_cov_7.711560~~NODE_15984_length_1018_cov_7.711560.p1  ORF type:complete len:241 (-),score=55.74 NODE_15984_length_1018_cov_7.711560:147-869(-)